MVHERGTVFGSTGCVCGHPVDIVQGPKAVFYQCRHCGTRAYLGPVAVRQVIDAFEGSDDGGTDELQTGEPKPAAKRRERGLAKERERNKAAGLWFE